MGRFALGTSLFAFVALSGCATSFPRQVHVLAVAAPDHFLVLEEASGQRRPLGPGPDCRSPLVDPGDGTRLVLVRSERGLGDYAPAAPRYGLGPSDLLRIDCRSGAPVGRVRR